MTTYEGAAAAPETDLAKHPAVVAWRQLYEDGDAPAKIQSLRKQNVFRLVGVGPRCGNVVAKRCRKDRMIENHVYENILPLLSVSHPAYYGHVKETRGSGYWLFIEDAGDERYAPHSKEHQALVPKWLAELHTSAFRLRKPRLLPDRDASWFLSHLRMIRSSIHLQRSSWAHLADEASAFQLMLSQCDLLESRWDEIESTCNRVPPTLVHCDFVPKNMCVRSSGREDILLPFDWEMAGWGNPATDIAHLIATPGVVLSRSQLIVDPDWCEQDEGAIEAYWSIVREHWPHLDLQKLERLALVGQIFRMLLAVGWALEGTLISPAPKSPTVLAKNEQSGRNKETTRWPPVYLEHAVSVLRLYQPRMACVLSVM